MPYLKKPTGNHPAMVVKPQAGWQEERHTSCELWGQWVKSPVCESSARVQWQLLPPCWMFFLGLILCWSEFLQCPGNCTHRGLSHGMLSLWGSEGTAGWGKQESPQPARTASPRSHPRLRQELLHRLLWSSNKCTSLQHSCCFSPTPMEQELAPLGTRCGCSHPCSTISGDHCFVQLIFVMFTSVSAEEIIHQAFPIQSLQGLDFSLEEHPFCLLACGPCPIMWKPAGALEVHHSRLSCPGMVPVSLRLQGGSFGSDFWKNQSVQWLHGNQEIPELYLSQAFHKCDL